MHLANKYHKFCHRCFTLDPECQRGIELKANDSQAQGWHMKPAEPGSEIPTVCCLRSAHEAEAAVGRC